MITGTPLHDLFDDKIYGYFIEFEIVLQSWKLRKSTKSNA